jgi:esterase
MLNYIEHGQKTDAPDLLIARGLFGSARNWGVLAKRLSDIRRVISVDMRNHGASPREDSQTYPDMADDLAQVIDHFGGRMDVLGHSMGGKAAMVLALANPSLVNRLIVADIAPVTYTHTQSHLIDAMQAVDLTHITRRSEASAALEHTIDDPMIRAFLLQSLDVKAQKWMLNLDVLRDQMPEIIGFPTVTGQFDGLSVFLSGAQSDYVTRDHRDAIKPLFTNTKFAKIPDAGHWLHAEKPREFEAAVRAILA